MTLSCPNVRERFPAYLDERLPREERSAVRGHLAQCADCRREASAVEPALLFATLAPEDVPGQEAARILEAVRAGIALKTAEKRLARTPPRRRSGATAAAVAAAVVIAFTLSTPSPRQPLPLAAPAERGQIGPRPVPLPAAAAQGDGNAAGAPTGPLSPFVEASGPAKGKLPADATIYDWNPGGGQPRVVWIVDRSLDI